jgi:osmotically-inducible protein OsmY
VVRQLDWDPEVDASAIGVIAKEASSRSRASSTVTRESLPPSASPSTCAASGAVANDITVRLLVDRTDADIAHDQAAAVRHVGGLLGVLNHITVAPKSGHRDVQRRIVRALHRNADLDVREVSVTVSNDVAT